MTIPGFSRPVTAIVEYTIVVQCHSGWMGGWPLANDAVPPPHDGIGWDPDIIL